MAKISNNKGFSLAELLAVVAIIGILVVIGIPNYQRFREKAQSVEAKNLLSAIHSSQKVFHLEYNAYHSNFSAIGFAPLGNLRYNVGFGDVGDIATAAANGFGGNASLDSTRINAKAICGGLGSGTDPNCTIIEPPTDLESIMTVTGIGYFAGASRTIGTAQTSPSGNLPSTGSAVALLLFGSIPAYAGPNERSLMDTWVINERKELLNIKEDVEQFCRSGSGHMSSFCGEWGTGYNGD